MLNSVPITDRDYSSSGHPITAGSSPTLQIEKLVVGGAGLGRIDGTIILCPDTLPGELVRLKILKRRKGVWLGKCQDILEPHESRQIPPCPYVGHCGGCQLQHMTYPVQIQQKGLMVRETLHRIGKQPDIVVEPVRPSPRPLAYRFTVRLTVGRKNGQWYFGFYESQSRKIFPIDKCLLAVEELRHVLQHVEEVLRRFDPPPRDLAQVEIRWSALESACLVIVRGFMNEQSALPAWIQKVAQIPSVKGVVYERFNHSDYSYRTQERKHPLIQGSDHLWQAYLGLRLKVGFRSFLQANWTLFETIGKDLIKDMVSLSGLRLLELYAGTAPLGLVLSHAGIPVSCVEINPFAVNDALESIKANRAKDCRVRVGEAEFYLKTVQPGQFNGILLDPPRSGLTAPVVNRVAALKIPRLWYLSCDMPTMARDVHRLCSQGYRVHRVQPYDMFPQTAHLETLVILTM